jgi:hypothetical protein
MESDLNTCDMGILVAELNESHASYNKDGRKLRTL